MVSKLQAARIAMASGFGLVLAAGQSPEILLDIVAGKDIGTYFVPRAEPDVDLGADVPAGFLAGLNLYSQVESHVAVVLVINQAIRCDRKYPRYRMTEIRLTFALEGIRHRVAKYVAEGKAAQDAMLQAIKEFHGKIESLVLEEFGEFFREMTTLDELHKQLSARSDAGH